MPLDGKMRCYIGLMALANILDAGIAAAPAAKSAWPPPSMFAGTWMANFGGKDGTIDISRPSPHFSLYGVDVSIIDQDCIQDLQGIATRERNLLELNLDQSDGSNCRMYFLRKRDGLKIWNADLSGKRCSGRLGAPCQFEGTAVRTSPESDQAAPTTRDEEKLKQNFFRSQAGGPQRRGGGNGGPKAHLAQPA